jgi:hypothetical protein
VYIFVRNSNGDLTFLNNVNERVARLLNERWADSATNFLEVVSISNRKVTLRTIDFYRRRGEEYQFTITVSPNGSIYRHKGTK